MEKQEKLTHVLKVTGMTCMDCAKTVSNFLIKEHVQNPRVEFLTGEVVFEEVEQQKLESIISGINKLGYKVQDDENLKKEITLTQKFIFSLILTTPLLFGHFFTGISFLENSFFQLFLSLPVFSLGVIHFGRSAVSSLKMKHPNMDVLILIGSSSAFFYSLFSMIYFFDDPHLHHKLFFETASSIVCFVLLGQLIEQKAVFETTNSLKDLVGQLPKTAKRISLQFGREIINEISIDEVNKFDLVLVSSGDKIPADGEVYEGTGTVDESMISGESFPVDKSVGSKVFGGTILQSGTIKLRAETKGDKTVLSGIIKLVKDANSSKPEIQKIGDLVSGYFVLGVVAISIVSFPINYFITHSLIESFLRSIAVLVISCPCAMGLATPTAVMVGVGLATKKGLLIKGGNTLEALAKIDTVVFDKTGTLTTGKFKLNKISIDEKQDEKFVKNIIYTLESFSSHPIAITLKQELESTCRILKIDDYKEFAGIGVEAIFESTIYKLISGEDSELFKVVSLYKNQELIATLFIEDEPREGIEEMLTYLKSKNKKVVLMSGDKKNRVESFAVNFNFDNVYYETTPEQKLVEIQKLRTSSYVAMIGDGINDAPALSLANVGISLSDANASAINSAQVVVLKNNKLKGIEEAFELSSFSYNTIKQNLFWAFLYNIVAIPIAASGGISPMLAAFSMAFSDVIVIGNSLLLKLKRRSK
jgi:Cu+-exporting ATPase